VLSCCASEPCRCFPCIITADRFLRAACQRADSWLGWATSMWLEVTKAIAVACEARGLCLVFIFIIIFIIVGFINIKGFSRFIFIFIFEQCATAC
jgi:hypothetical protein